jgi:urease accessory protein
VAAAALFHGLAHGGEVPDAASPVLYVAGFLAATATLHVAGVLLGPAVVRWRPVQAIAGAAVAAVGVMLVAGV